MGATGSIAQGAGTGGATGAEIGSIVPGVGTVAGGIIGGIIGGAVGYFARPKKVQTPQLADLNPPNAAANAAAANLAATAAGTQQAQRNAAAQGRGSTILTGPLGLPPAPVTPTNTALGQ